MMIGTAASTPSPAMLRRRPKISHSSDRKNRSDGPPGSDGGRQRPRVQPLTPKPSPVSVTNTSSRLTGTGPNARTGTRSMTSASMISVS